MTASSRQTAPVDDSRPVIEFSASLPISAYVDDISNAIRSHQVTVICGETGSGKTTQIPKICLRLGYGHKAMIGHTQPRRIAARSIATRLADELQVKLGKTVGFQIRHHDLSNEQTRVKLMTDGVLLAQMQHDALLRSYEVLIIDEAHERSLNIDFILGYLKRLLPKRPDLKVIITSATIDVERFSEHFSSAPVISLTGRTFPVELRYRPPDENYEDSDEQTERGLLHAIDELSRENLGDILVFVHGEGEIHRLEKFLNKRGLPNTEILPLYSRLSRRSQARIFQPHSKRHIVLATNVAETSLTIPGITHVIDFGDARVSRYSPKSKIQRLPVEKISQAAARQRMGRCGRTHEGICIRLYSEEDYLQRPEFTEPEILRTNLATVILQMKSMRLGDVEDFPFLDVPNKKLVTDGIRLLTELSALDKQQNLTTVGRTMARMPLDPRLARMIIAADRYHCIDEMTVICAFLSIQDPRDRPLDMTEKADKAHGRYADVRSDFMSVLKLWHFIQQQRSQLSRKKFQKFCKTNFLSPARITEWCEVEKQLDDLSQTMKFKNNVESADYNNIHCALIYGLLSHIALKDSKGHHYQGARGNKLYIFPGSGVFETRPEWIVAAELVETSKLYARQVAKIDPKWLLKPGKHLCKREINEPYWDEKKKAVMVRESTYLYGLPVQVDVLVHYAKHNPTHARELFIQEGLVHCRLDSSAKFYLHNKNIIDQVKQEEIKTRRFDRYDEQAAYAFYDQRLPKNINSVPTLDQWRKKAEKETPEILFVTLSEVSNQTDHNDLNELYPDTISAAKAKLDVSYDYSPGQESDGITVNIPGELINHLVDMDFEANFPEYSQEKLALYVKKLPKVVRQKCHPLNEFTSQCVSDMRDNRKTLVESFRDNVWKTAGHQIDNTIIQQTDIPAHLRLHYRVIDSEGNCLASGEDLIHIHDQLMHTDGNQKVSTQNTEYLAKNIKTWDFGELPVEHMVNINGMDIGLFPGLFDEGDCVSIKLFNTREKADQAMVSGLVRLYALYLSKEIKYLKKNLSNQQSFKLQSRHVYSFSELIDEMVLKVVENLFVADYSVVRKKADFEELLSQKRHLFVSRFQEFYRQMAEVFENYFQILLELEEMFVPLRKQSLDDVREQLSYLVYGGFIRNTGYARLLEYPRYLSSILKRLAKLANSLAKDREKMEQVRCFTEILETARVYKKAESEIDTKLVELRWMVEEYRISLFSQEIKTRYKISSTKIRDYMRENNIEIFNA